MPSFNLVTEGTDILKTELLSLFLNQDISGFQVYIVGTNILKFCHVKNLKKLMES